MSKECCSTEENPPEVSEASGATQRHTEDHDHSHDHGDKSIFQLFVPALLSFALLCLGLVLQYWLKPDWFSEAFRLALYLAAYIPVGFPVVKEAFIGIEHGDFFSEFFLMTIATAGAFAIGEYPEGVAVMLFYCVGEVFQTMAVQKAKLNIKSLLDQRPDEVTIMENNIPKRIKAQNAAVGQIIQLKPGEKLALDGELLSETASFNTSALTGESKPNTKRKGDMVLAGMINLNTLALVKISTPYEDSKLSRILEMVQNATSQKAKTELFIRKFAKIYTPIVVFLAIAICLLPYFFVAEYEFRDWLYRALVFLVISCPCALVISIPLGYFGGIGAGSRNGILFKGSNFLDTLSGVKHVVMDKTGTMTEGVFKVHEVILQKGFDKKEVLQHLNTLESKSSHPIATAIREFAGPVIHTQVEDFEEIAGHGLRGTLEGKEYLAGNFKLMEKFNIAHQIEHSTISDTLVAIAVDGKFAGYLTIADQIKDDADYAVNELKKLGVSITMLSGDKTAVVKEVAAKIGIMNAFGDLLPEDKVNKVKDLKSGKETVAFVGDGVNDAPVVALSDVGMAMGGLGSDATIETADVVIQDDRPSKIPMAIIIGRETKKIVWQNILLAFGVKAVVLILGAGGVATMWEAVFADVGVALLAILNAVRIQHMNFTKIK
ncbi:cadmium-translocating P-type ATPase [Marnyiella aurantia]|uniref:P-type Zn(2+) transporter n=1 Tax=Marnyiella aurantia TaxID=2758037 RepID=A0A7D7QK55_9FLAO|nr:heavy metal translocating P-type ATPase [Marnyiella aurantia]MBA5246620.1 cadmium-translocating P-type ATPase [Marnyiella aurantia]QMS98025.1 cadmium-translocating P-type ATPase [Marnyiella aurantia]